MELSIRVVGKSETLAVRVQSYEDKTVLALKELIHAQDPKCFPVATQRLLPQGTALEDDKILISNLSLQSGMELELEQEQELGLQVLHLPDILSFLNQPPSLRGYLKQMRDEEGFDDALRTLMTLCDNFFSHPTKPAHYKLHVHHNALNSCLLDRPHGLDCVWILGFKATVEEDHRVFVPNAEQWANLLTCKRVLDQFRTTAPVEAFEFVPREVESFLSDFDAFFGGGRNPFTAAQEMAQNPTRLLQMMQGNPMCQRLAQMDATFAKLLDTQFPVPCPWTSSLGKNDVA